jgi:TonB-linked SusC/RagA family outer membrane protein
MNIFALNSYSQTGKVSLNLKNAKVEDVLNQIEKSSEYYFAYNQKLINVNRKIDISANNKAIKEVLHDIFKNTNTDFVVINHQIVLSPKQISDEDLAGIQQQKKGIVVTGSVKDEKTGESLPGVSVLIKGTSRGAITDGQGKFSITVNDPNAVVSFTFMGYDRQDINLSGKTSITIAMASNIKSLEEVVVVGYGTQKKVNLTGSVSSVSFAEQALTRPVTNVSSALAGLSSGVTIRQGVGKPGEDGATIMIHGQGTLNNSAPLVIIDGMEGVLDAVNPNDIESVSILKDAASASIYGSRAANGVILVTTKKGNKDRISVSYSGHFSVAQPSNLLGFVNDYPRFMKLMNESARNIGTAEVFSQNTIDAWTTANKNPNGLTANGVPNWVAYPNTNWQKEVYQSNLVQDHTISVNGGTKNTTFLLSAGYMDDPGLVQNTGIKRYTFRANVEANVNKWLTLGTRTYGSMQDKALGNYSNLLTYMKATTPGLIGMYKGQYGYPEAPEESATANNVFGFLNASNGTDMSSRFNTTLYSKITFMKGLSWDFNFNYTKRLDEYNSYTNPDAAQRLKFSTGTIMAPKTDPSLMTTYYNTYVNYSYTLENLLRYETTIAKNHSISALVGYNEYYYDEYNHDSNQKGLIDASIYTPNTATLMQSITGTETDRALRSVFGRVNYGFKDRYLFEANLRYDGSSRFSTDSRWGVFPSFSAAWRLSEEDFIKKLGIVQNLKLRASWGQLGNNASGDYDYQSLYGKEYILPNNTKAYYSYSYNGVLVAGLASGKIPNSLLKWESTNVTNIGLDASFLNSRLSTEIDVYNKVTNGILTTPPVYLTLGLKTAPTQNTAEVTNKGIDVTVRWKDKIGDLNYSVSANLAYNHNEVTKYKGKNVNEWRKDAITGADVYYSNIGDVSSGGSTRVLEGHAINEYYLLSLYKGTGSYFNTDGTVNKNGGPKDGMIRTPDDMKWLQAMTTAGYKFMPNQGVSPNKIWYGDFIYADKNNDGIYGSSYDNEFQGSSSMPKYSFGTQINVSWKNFDLGMVWAGNAGFKLYWLEQGYDMSNLRYGLAIGSLVADNHYYYNAGNVTSSTISTDNINAKYPRLKLNETDGQNIQASTFYLYDASYIKLKNLSVGYTLPKNVAKKIFTERVRVYFSVENLFTITKFPGLDPEAGANTNYPTLRQVSLGANITF